MSRKFFAALLSGMLVMALAMPAMAAPPDQGGKTTNKRGGPKAPYVGLTSLACYITGAKGNVPGANLYIRNQTNSALPAGTKIQWKAGPEIQSGSYTLGVPLAPGAEKMIAKVYDKTCQATIVP